MSFWNETYPKARKVYECYLCSRAIDKGTVYYAGAGLTCYGDWSSVKEHLACHKVAQEYWNTHGAEAYNADDVDEYARERLQELGIDEVEGQCATATYGAHLLPPLTLVQKQLMRHALGLDKARKSYRNDDVARIGSDLDLQWLELVKQGRARVDTKTLRIDGIHACYQVTKIAAKVVANG